MCWIFACVMQLPGYVPQFESKEIGDKFDKHAQMGMDMSVSFQLHSVGFVVVSRGAAEQTPLKHVGDGMLDMDRHR